MSFRPHLWRVMETANGSNAELQRILGQATPEQLILLNCRFKEAVGELRASARFAARATDESHLASWVVSLGRRAFSEALEDPRNLPETPPLDAPDFQRTIESTYRERFGAQIPEEEPAPSRELALKYDPVWESTLWDIIDVGSAGVPLEEALSGFTRSELVKLQRALSVVSERLREKAELSLGEDPASAGWALWAEWFLAKGKDAHDRFLANREEVPREVPEEDELLRDRLDRVYEDRYGSTVLLSATSG